MFVVTVQFAVLPEYAERFLAEMNANAEASVHLEEGCRQFDVCTGDAGTVFLYEVYDSEAAFQLHLKSQHFLSFNETTTAWVADKTVATYKRSYPVPQRRRMEVGA
jgi:(4S)-4-hydroxy-5-phosphonooxypentane-2,3-dione isomerase